VFPVDTFGFSAVSNCNGSFLCTETSARIDSADSRRVTADVTRGGYEDMGGAPPDDFMKAAVRIGSNSAILSK